MNRHGLGGKYTVSPTNVERQKDFETAVKSYLCQQYPNKEFRPQQTIPEMLHQISLTIETQEDSLFFIGLIKKIFLEKIQKVKKNEKNVIPDQEKEELIKDLAKLIFDTGQLLQWNNKLISHIKSFLTTQFDESLAYYFDIIDNVFLLAHPKTAAEAVKAHPDLFIKLPEHLKVYLLETDLDFALAVVKKFPEEFFNLAPITQSKLFDLYPKDITTLFNNLKTDKKEIQEKCIQINSKVNELLNNQLMRKIDTQNIPEDKQRLVLKNIKACIHGSKKLDEVDNEIKLLVLKGLLERMSILDKLPIKIEIEQFINSQGLMLNLVELNNTDYGFIKEIICLPSTQVFSSQNAKVLVEEALTKVNNSLQNDKPIRFDIQGHVLVEIKLTDGKKTYCNLDSKNIPDLKKAFEDWLSNIDNSGLSETEKERLKSAISEFMDSQSRSSVIPLQEEMEMHLSLIMNVLRDKIFEYYRTDRIEPSIWEKIQQQSFLKINQKVKEVFQKALISSLEVSKDSQPKINFAKLNTALDKSRLELARETRRIFFQTAIHLTKSNKEDYKFVKVYEEIKHLINNHDFESKTASDADYLRTDGRNHTVTHISGTDKTAHDKRPGDAEVALRVIHRNSYRVKKDGQIEVTALPIPHIEARAPSIAVSLEYDIQYDQKTGKPIKGTGKKAKGPEAVNDVNEKLKVIFNQLNQEMPHYHGPIIYNLLTSHHSSKYDKSIDGHNRQRKSAKRILRGAHLFNSERITSGHSNRLCLVQNLGVTKHSEDLNYDSSNDVIAEATLMTEIAMLYTYLNSGYELHPEIKEILQTGYSDVMKNYHEFLNAHKGQNDFHEILFKDSPQGKQTITQLKALKLALSKKAHTLLAPSSTDTVSQLALKALIKIMANNQHWKKDYGMIVQSLSVFVEKISFGGCKSANERHQNMSGRVDLMTSIYFRQIEAQEQGTELTFSPSEQALIASLNEFINSQDKEQDKKALDQLQCTYAKAFNEHDLYGAVTAISEMDQGGPSKLQACLNWGWSTFKSIVSIVKTVKSYFDTNYAESSYLTFFKQSKASGMQAHKAKLAKELNKEFDEISKSNVSLPTSNTRR